jgi:undecaprenyl diphosphate synthase
LTADNTAGTVALCFNYGGQLEIVDAVKNIIDSGTKSSDLTPELINQNMYHPDVPALDLVVRTSGEHRLSNFLLWRVAYSEMIFLDKMWPDMTHDDVRAILDEYAKRSRRFGA